MTASKIYMIDGTLYHEDCADSQDLVDATVITDVDGDDVCEECGKPLVNTESEDDEG